MKINQFHSGTAVGDAITNQILMIQALLSELGYKSEIYAEHIAKPLETRIKPINAYKGDVENILLIHHSMGFDGFERIIALPDQKALIYHNITPEHFFEDDYTKKYIRLGLWQAAEYRKYLDYFIAASNYNRKELLRMGHKNVDVMPVQISLGRFECIESDRYVLSQYAKKKNILFVGRIVKNKRQEDIIRAFAKYHHVFAPDSNLFLVGDLHGGYCEELKVLCRILKVQDAVQFTGKVSEEELKAYYETASAFLCMSEHEGFGVPLLEAMVMGIPVLAFASSAIAETMNGAGILLWDKNINEIASLMQEIIEDKILKDKLVSKQFERIERLKHSETKEILEHVISNMCSKTRKRSIQIQGPFETSYSLAIVNRKLAQALDNFGKDDVSIYCTEGTSDYIPQQKDLKDKPHAKALWEKSHTTPFPDIVIRNMYPPRVSDTNGALNFQAFAWEEDRVPSDYVQQFNRYLSGIGTTSNFVTEILKCSGLKIPVKTMGNGVDLPEGFENMPPYPLKTKKTICFLHISSAFPRKGVDILLNAYFKAFTAKDDVCLVLKTFPNPHNRVEEDLVSLRLQYPNAPEVEWINKDLPEDKLYGLYKSASCYVHVARGEGFGLTVAEAMLAKVPVIVSPNTGMADFCNQDTAMLVGFDMKVANSHVSDDGSQWAEPNRDELVQRLKEFVAQSNVEGIKKHVEQAYKLISTKYTWNAVAERWTSFINEVESQQFKPKVAMVTPWNTKCGIAEYTRFMCDAMANTTQFGICSNYGASLLKRDETYVRNRFWCSAFEGDMTALSEHLGQSHDDIIHFQFNFAFYKLEQLADTIMNLYGRKKIVITFHKTKDSNVGGEFVSLVSIKDALNCCDCLVVHQQEDVDVLTAFGVKPNLIQIIPHGQVKYESRAKTTVREQLKIDRSLIIGSYGFLLPNKGIIENIKALPLIKQEYPDVLYIVCCALHESIESRIYYKKCRDYVNTHNLQNNVVFVTDYIKPEESLVLLQACDLFLMNYLPSEESASGAVRFCIAAQRPLITTKQKIFEEFKNCAFQISVPLPDNIASAVNHIIKNNQDEFLVNMEKYCQVNSWESVAKQYDYVYRKLVD